MAADITVVNLRKTPHSNIIIEAGTGQPGQYTHARIYFADTRYWKIIMFKEKLSAMYSIAALKGYHVCLDIISRRVVE